MRALSDLFTLLKLNLLTILCSLPLVTAGAALTALHYCLMKVLDGKDGNTASMYLEQFRANLRSMILPWLLIAVAAGGLFLNLRIFSEGEGAFKAALIPAYLGIFLLHGMNQWFFPMAARFENTTAAKFRNALLMAAGAFPRTLAMMVISAILPFVLFYSPQLLPLAFLYGLSLPAYLCCFLYYPVIKGQIKRITGEEETEEGEEDAYIQNIEGDKEP